MTERRNGARRLYRVDTDGLAEVRDYLDSFWTDVLAAFEAAAEAEARTGGRMTTQATETEAIRKSVDRAAPDRQGVAALHRRGQHRGGRSQSHSIGGEKTEAAVFDARGQAPLRAPRRRHRARLGRHPRVGAARPGSCSTGASTPTLPSRRSRSGSRPRATSTRVELEHRGWERPRPRASARATTAAGSKVLGKYAAKA